MPKKDAARIAQALAALRDDPRPRGVLKVKNASVTTWRLRIGRFRALYTVSDAIQLIVVLHIRRRSEDTYDI
ncbi:MAG: type II toxin-antitoxin system RelE/ParE family toxin [Dehalococcoidia bacterium]